MRTALIGTVGLLLVLGGCSSTPTELSASTNTVVRTYPENYQEIYRRIAEPAQRCWASSAGMFASTKVYAQLYPELGYGDVNLSLKDMGASNYYWSAKIAKDAGGTKLTMHAGNTLAAGQYIKKALGWATGGTSC